jgi:hypothetical protein
MSEPRLSTNHRLTNKISAEIHPADTSRQGARSHPAEQALQEAGILISPTDSSTAPSALSLAEKVNIPVVIADIGDIKEVALDQMQRYTADETFKYVQNNVDGPSGPARHPRPWAPCGRSGRRTGRTRCCWQHSTACLNSSTSCARARSSLRGCYSRSSWVSRLSIFTRARRLG